MIKTEIVEINGKNFTYNYSDDGHYIENIETGEQYVSAYDPEDSNRTYKESEMLLTDEIVYPELPDDDYGGDEEQ